MFHCLLLLLLSHWSIGGGFMTGRVANSCLVLCAHMLHEVSVWVSEFAGCVGTM